jgi:hypothetical protein
VLTKHAIFNRDANPTEGATQVLVKKMNIFGPGMEESEIDDKEEVVLRRTTKIQQLQLARSAAAVLIQAVYRGWMCRLRFNDLLNSFLSTKRHGGYELFDVDRPNVRDLRVQVT